MDRESTMKRNEKVDAAAMGNIFWDVAFPVARGHFPCANKLS
jgi:hypothetical protein